jgi:hypothetical protein
LSQAAPTFAACLLLEMSLALLDPNDHQGQVEMPL